jgi:hypothetical protein
MLRLTLGANIKCQGGHYLSSDKMGHVSKGNHSHQLPTPCHRRHRTTSTLLSESDNQEAMSKDDTAPESTLPYPPVLKDKKFVVLTDW